MKETIFDEYGKWEVDVNIKVLKEPSQKWYDEYFAIELKPQPPTTEERIEALELALLEVILNG